MQISVRLKIIDFSNSFPKIKNLSKAENFPKFKNFSKAKKSINIRNIKISVTLLPKSCKNPKYANFSEMGISLRWEFSIFQTISPKSKISPRWTKKL